MTTAMSLRLPEKLSKALDELAERAERPKSYLVRKILEDYVSGSAKSSRTSEGAARTEAKFPPGKIGHSLDEFAGGWSRAEAKEFMDSVKIFEEIDKKLWK